MWWLPGPLARVKLTEYESSVRGGATVWKVSNAESQEAFRYHRSELRIYPKEMLAMSSPIKQFRPIAANTREQLEPPSNATPSRLGQ